MTNDTPELPGFVQDERSHRLAAKGGHRPTLHLVIGDDDDAPVTGRGAGAALRPDMRR